MGYTKRQFLTAAFDELGLASYVFDISPEQLESAVRRLDAMMAEWNAKGIRCGYPLPGSPENSLFDHETTVPDSLNEAIICNLATRIAPSYGKQAMPGTMRNAKSAFNTVLTLFANTPEMQMPSDMPKGAGYKNYDNPFMPAPSDNVIHSPENEVTFLP